jgi:hypothetical protein
MFPSATLSHASVTDELRPEFRVQPHFQQGLPCGIPRAACPTTSETKASSSEAQQGSLGACLCGAERSVLCWPRWFKGTQ